MTTDYNKLNPCEYESIVRLLAWAETDCWCCTTIRSGLAFGVLGVVVGLALGGKCLVALLTFSIAGPLVIVALHVARLIWKDDSEGRPSE